MADVGLRSKRNRLNVLSRHHGADAPVTVEARREYEVSRAEQMIRSVVDSAPPLRPEDIERLRSLLPSPSRTSGGGHAA